VKAVPAASYGVGKTSAHESRFLRAAAAATTNAGEVVETAEEDDGVVGHVCAGSTGCTCVAKSECAI
jgi:hypothetical protein